MTKSNVHKDEIDWLIIVACTSEEEELRNESLEKLNKLGLSLSNIKERFKGIDSDDKQLKAFEKAWKTQKERNENEKYTLSEKIKIFLFGPYELFRNLNSGLTELKELNYRSKFFQRLTLLIAGTLFWIILLVMSFKYNEYQRIKEIEEVDISNWEENRLDKE